MYTTVRLSAEILPVGHGGAVVTETGNEYAESPPALDARTAYVCEVETGRSVSEKDVAAPEYTMIPFLSTTYSVAVGDALHESDTSPTPHDVFAVAFRFAGVDGVLVTHIDPFHEVPPIQLPTATDEASSDPPSENVKVVFPFETERDALPDASNENAEPS